MASHSPAPIVVSPAVVALPARGVNFGAARLPTPPTPLVGREHESAAVSALLGREDVRVLTLHGPGGVGKTRLALAAAEAAAAGFDSVAYVSLGAVPSPDLVGPTLFQALGGRDDGDFSHARLHALVGDAPLLLVLDNFEHLIAAAPLVGGLLDACPRLKALVTSRVTLRLAGEQAYLVPPLALPDGGEERGDPGLEAVPAIRLFAQRARAARADFVLDARNVADVAAICRRLDGLPLAIELAAARVTHLSPRALLERMDHPDGGRLPLLSGGPRDLPARQQTMRDAIAWSFALLDAAERALLPELAVFVGGFTLEAAERVTGDGFQVSATALDSHVPDTRHPSPDTLDLLASLVARSLVRYEGDVGGEPRYGMLQTIREFALERLAAGGNAEAVRDRHADWQLDLAERAFPHLKGPRATEWGAVLEREHANLRAALVWLLEREDGARLARLAGAIWPFWQEHAHYGEGRRWLAAALERGDAAPAADRLRVLTGAGTLAWYQADVADSRRMCERALSLAREIGDREAEAYQLGNLAVHASELGDRDLAMARYEASLAVAREAGSPSPMVLALHNLAIEDWERDEHATSMGRLEEALALAREHAMGWALPFVLAGMGSTALSLGDPTRAVAHYRESIALAQTRGNLGDVIDAIEGMARVAASTEQAADAARIFGATAAMREALPYPRTPGEVDRFEAVADAMREALGVAGFDAAWAEGRALSQEAAIATALAVSADAPAREAASDRLAPGHGLTERELEVLRLLAAGRSNREIGDALFISPATAARHVANIYLKLGVDSRAEATAFALQQELV